VTLLPNVDVLLIVKPFNVIVIATLAASVVPAVVITMDVAVGAPGVRLVPGLQHDTSPVGVVSVALDAKNPEGYFSVMVLPATSAPPAVGWKTNVTVTLDLLGTRSMSAMEKKMRFDAPPIAPEQHIYFEIRSELVSIPILPPAVSVLPIDKPDSVMVTATLALRVEPCATVIEMVVPFGGPVGVRRAPAVEIEPVGVGLAAKKFDG